MRRLSLFYPTSTGYIQIVAKECDQAELESMGFVDHSDKLKPVEPEIQTEIDHIEFIKGMDDKRAIEAYVLDLTDINIDLRGKLETVQDKAIGAIESWKQQAQ